MNMDKVIMSRNSNSSWIGVDLDGTLAEYSRGDGIARIGRPIQPMLDRVINWIKDGELVKIVTARAGQPGQHELITKWLIRHVGQSLEITNRKDFRMSVLWDDRAVQVIPNTGKPVSHLFNRCAVCKDTVSETFLFSDSVIQQAGLVEGDKVHLDCLSLKLGRKLTREDFLDNDLNRSALFLLG